MLPKTDMPRGSIPSHIWYALLMRCPRCCKGGMWRAPLRMHRTCPHCSLAFEREPGYFLGAMYASYFIGMFITMPAWWWVMYNVQSWPFIAFVTIAMVLLVWPIAFHYSRPVWIHIDYFVEPWNFQTNEDVPGFEAPAPEDAAA